MIEVEFKLPKESFSIETLRKKLPALHYPGLHVHRLSPGVEGVWLVLLPFRNTSCTKEMFLIVSSKIFSV